MKSTYSKVAGIITLIPIILIVLVGISFFFASVLEMPTNRGGIYTMFAMISILGALVAPLIFLPAGVAGTIFSIKGIREGDKISILFLILSILAFVAFFVAIYFWYIIIFVTGPSV